MAQHIAVVRRIRIQQIQFPEEPTGPGGWHPDPMSRSFGTEASVYPQPLSESRGDRRGNPCRFLVPLPDLRRMFP